MLLRSGCSVSSFVMDKNVLRVKWHGEERGSIQSSPRDGNGDGELDECWVGAKEGREDPAAPLGMF